MTGEATENSDRDRAHQMAKSSRRLSALTMLSRLLGLAREQIFALTLGAGATSDAFLAAFRIPNLLRDLFAEGALAKAFTPNYVATLQKESRAAAYALANRVASTLTFYLGVLALATMLFPEPVVRLVAAGFSAEKAELCATLVRIMMPFLPLISLAAVAMGALNAERKYTAPALASSMFNLVAIVGGMAVYAAGVLPRTAAIVWAALTLVGGVAQVATQVPSLWRAGFRPRFLPDLRLRDEGTRRVAMMMAPAALGVAAVQVNVVVNTTFASLISDGAISWLSYAFRLMQLPIGVFGVAVGTTALTELSADAGQGNMSALQANLRRALRLVLFLTIPSTVGLALLGVPIIRLIFQHGKFSSDATLQTARALSGYAVGLVAYAAIKVLAMPFYALKRVRVPVIASLTAVAANLAWNVATYRTLGHVGLALGTSIAALANFIVLAVVFQTQIKGLLTRDLLLPLLRILAASAVMGAVVWFISREIEARTAGATSSAIFAFQAFVPILIGAAVYFAAARLFGIEEARTLTRRFR